MKGEFPDGFALRHVLRVKKRPFTRLAWGGDERLLVSGSHDQTLRLWDVVDGRICFSLFSVSVYEFPSLAKSLIAGGKNHYNASTYPILAL